MRGAWWGGVGGVNSEPSSEGDPTRPLHLSLKTTGRADSIAPRIPPGHFVTMFGCLVVWLFGSLVLGFWRRVEGSWGVSWGVRGGPGSVPGGSVEGSWGVLVAPGALLGGSWAEGVRGKRFPGPPKTAQDGPSGPKTLPRRPQDSPGRPQEAPKTGQEAPKTAQEAPKTAPEAPKTAPTGCPDGGPTSPRRQRLPGSPKRPPRGHHETPKRPPGSPKRPTGASQQAPKRLPRGPKTTPQRPPRAVRREPKKHP